MANSGSYDPAQETQPLSLPGLLMKPISMANDPIHLLQPTPAGHVAPGEMC